MDLNYIHFAFPGLAKVRCAFQTRLQGKGQGHYAKGNISFNTADEPVHVLANRQSMLNSLKIESFAEVYQVHGTKLIFEPSPCLPEDKVTLEADGLATSQPGLALMIKTADCQPVLLAHKSGRYVCGMHVGWRGNLQKFIASGVAEFCTRYQISAQDILAVRGPSLGPQAAEFINFAKEWGDEWLPFFDATNKTMNLWQLTKHQLECAGLLPQNIYSLDLCTYANHELFFSYRREHASGRQASLIWIDHD